MTDSEIIKALECCTTKGKSCKNCPAYVKVDRSNCKEAFRGALDLINRQKAEIDCLQKELLKEMYDFETEYDSKIKAEARKEFAERLKEKAEEDYYGDLILYTPDIDELLKEMVGEQMADKEFVNHPDHYCRPGAMECIEEMIVLFGKEAVKNFCLCNAWKYRYRSTAKNGDEDLNKADWYIRKYKELCFNEEETKVL